jgi:hypothetical protein
VNRIQSLLLIIFDQNSSREFICFDSVNAVLAGQDGLNSQGTPRLIDEQGNIPPFTARNTRAEDQDGLSLLQIAVTHSVIPMYHSYDTVALTNFIAISY